jgi:non-ribosomal peptide synthetase component F
VASAWPEAFQDCCLRSRTIERSPDLTAAEAILRGTALERGPHCHLFDRNAVCDKASNVTDVLTGNEPRTLAEVLMARAASQPDTMAFVFEDARLTYGQLREQADALAAGLVQLGVGAGDRVALVLPAGLDFVRCFWAIQRAGAVSCAFNPATPAATTVRRALRIRRC